MDSQPDLNLRNENVCQEIENIMKFRLDLGIDGFLIDATQDKNVDVNMPYYGLNRWSRGHDMVINFFIAYFLGEKPEDQTGDGLAKFTESWLSNLPSGAWSTWILSSHDSKRFKQ
ncbi:unnamed protein product [Rotaria sp. Silwood2]|nr:unnamed protein product [Rotaria sp. Silwood2]CAF4308777.1 unnamed protein product [Rotaria sp. Silwood2]